MCHYVLLASLLSCLELFSKGAELAELMVLGQDWVTGRQAFSLSPQIILTDSKKKTLWKVPLHLIWLLSNLSTCRFLNCRMHRGTSLRRLLSNRSSLRERYVPTKENCSTPSLLRSLWDSWRDCRLDRR